MKAAHALPQLPAGGRTLRGRPPLTASVIAHLRAAELDGQLSAGVASWRSPAHAARAVQLTSHRRRRAVACSLERLVRDATMRPSVLSAVVPPCSEQVLEAKPAIVALVALLRSPEPIDARGVARLLGLLTDGAGPCYIRSDPRALARALQTASQWLDVVD